MMRLPRFRYHAPRSLREATRILHEEGAGAMVLAGGTDLVPNMKRRQQQPPVLISLGRIDELGRLDFAADGSALIGAGVTLRELELARRLAESHGALWRAVGQVATPLIRNQATIGGNVCLDTRCNYYNQSLEWRKAIDYCMKAPRGQTGVYDATAHLGRSNGAERDGEALGSVCWVAPGSPRCWAVQSSDSAPALVALGAEVELVSTQGTRLVPAAELYHDDGMAYLTRRADEIVSRVLVHRSEGWRSTYWKLRRRGSFDFPVLGVAVAIKRHRSGTVDEARVVLGAVASRPVMVRKASEMLVGRPLLDQDIADVADEAARLAKPMDNTDFALGWRKAVVKSFIKGALLELRGDDPRALGALARRATQHLPLPLLP
jgi:4-hydroxybenzoyl-CoA reductase subunit beta